MADTCTYCGKELGGVYQYYWGNPCHPECNPENIEAVKERERQRQIGRNEATRATPPAAVVEAMERALQHCLGTLTTGMDGVWDHTVKATDLTRAALTALTEWRNK